MKRLLTLLLSLCLTATIAAQEYGLYQMREVWNANYLNPGFIPRHQFVLSLPSARAGFHTVGLRGGSIFKYDAADNTTRFNGDIRAGDVNRDFTVRNYAQLDALGLGFRVNRGFVSFTTQTIVESRLRFPETFLRTVIEGTADYLNTPLDLGPSLDAMAYQKVSLGFSYSINPRLSVGGRVNRLLGLASVQTNRSQLTLLQSDDIYQTTVNLDYQLNYYGGGQFTPIDRTVEGLSNFEDAITEDDFESSDEFGFRQVNQSNNGWSVDIGAEYLFSDRLTLSASFINLGRINWKNNTQQVHVTGEFTYEGVDVAELEDYEDYEPIPGIDTVGTFQAVSGLSYQQALAPHSYIGANYVLNNYVELGGLLFNELSANGGLTALSLSSRFTLGRVVGLGLVYNLQHRSHNSLGANVALNLGPVQIYGVAGDVAAVVRPSRYNGGSFRAGLNLSFGRKKSESQLANMKQGIDPFPVQYGKLGSSRNKLLAKKRRKKKPNKNMARSRREAIAEPAKEPVPDSAEPEESTSGILFELKLNMYDESDREAVDVVYMDLYQEDDNRQQTLLRTGRYPKGKVATVLEASNKWHVAKISAYQYDTVEIRFQADPGKPLPLDWYMASLDEEGQATSPEDEVETKPEVGTASQEPPAAATEMPEDEPQEVEEVSAEEPEAMEEPIPEEPTSTATEMPEDEPQEVEEVSAEEPEAMEGPIPEEPTSTATEMPEDEPQEVEEVNTEEPQEVEEPVSEETPAAETEDDQPIEVEEVNAEAPQPEEANPVVEEEAEQPATQTEALQPPSSDYVLTKRTSLREAPDSQARVISRMDPGTELLLLERTNEWWWLVSMGGWEGYVKAHLLKEKN